MSALTVIEVLKGLKTLKDNLDNLDKFSKAAEKATKGKDPFPPPKKVQEALKKLRVLEAELKAIAKNGAGVPVDVKVGLPMLADPKTRAKATKLMQGNLQARDAFLADAGKLEKELAAIQKDASVRSQVARQIAGDFKKLVKAPLPDLGTLGKTTYLEYHLLFQKAAGALGSVASAAGKALARVRKDVKAIGSETKSLRTNMKTFGVL